MVKISARSYSSILKEFDASDQNTASLLKQILNTTYPFFQSASAYYSKTLKVQKKNPTIIYFQKLLF